MYTSSLKTTLPFCFLVIFFGAVPVYATGYGGYMGPGISQGVEQGGNALLYGIMQRREYEQQRAYEQQRMEQEQQGNQDQNYINRNLHWIKQEGSILNINPTASPTQRNKP